MQIICDQGSCETLHSCHKTGNQKKLQICSETCFQGSDAAVRIKTALLLKYLLSIYIINVFIITNIIVVIVLKYYYYLFV